MAGVRKDYLVQTMDVVVTTLVDAMYAALSVSIMTVFVLGVITGIVAASFLDVSRYELQDMV